ncbi:MAG TPA: tyrosine-protein phosphatase [Trichormus sp.]|jgi:protein tyrosine/serine phosphatase
MNNRHLDWAGCLNVRDLGGVPLPDGRATAWRGFVRSDAPNKLTDVGWQALRAYGVGTIVDLRHERERNADTSDDSEGIAKIHLPLEDLTVVEFWQKWNKYNCCPLYYQPFLEQFPQRVCEILTAMAEAGPGAVLFHCGIGRDRTGLLSLLLLALAGVEPDDIASDYELSVDRLNRHDEQKKIEILLAEHDTTARKTILSLLDSVDVESYLLTAGISPSDIQTLRAKLLGDAQA